MPPVLKTPAPHCTVPICVLQDLYAPSHKIAPEWTAIIEQLQPMISGGANVSVDDMAALLAKLPVAVEFDSSAKPLVVVQATFPRLTAPLPHQSGHKHAEAHARRIERVLREAQQTDAAAAAVADWTSLLQAAFGSGVRVRRGATHLLLVAAPPQHLEAVLAWLAERPAVHWISPQPRFHAAMRQATSVTQSSEFVGRGVVLARAHLGVLHIA